MDAITPESGPLSRGDEITPLDGGRSTDEDGRPSTIKRNLIRLVIVAVIAEVLLLGISWYIDYEKHGKYIQATNDAYVQADSVAIAPKVSGYIDRVFVHDDQDVKAGQPLFQVDPQDYEAQASQYRAQVELARATANQVQAMLGEQRAMIRQAEAQLGAARSNARFSAAEVSRYEPLAISGAEPRERLAHLRNEAQKAAAQLAQQQAAVVSAHQRISSLEAQIHQAQAQEQSVNAQLQTASRNVGSTLIRASINGRIGDKQARRGQFVQAGTRLTSIVPLDQIYVEANFKETQIGLMRIGQPVTIAVDALPGIELRGHVASLSPGTGAQFSVLPPQNATGNFTKIVQRIPVRIAIDAGPEVRRLLIPGMSVEARVDTISARGARERIEKEQEARERARK